MTNFEQKYQEFREAFREAVLNKEIRYEVKSAYTSGFNGVIVLYIEDNRKVEISVANDNLCYHNEIIDGVFNKDDISKLNSIIKEYSLEVKRNRLEKLKKEIIELEKEVA